MTRTERIGLEGLEIFGTAGAEELPGWVPAAARNYLAHTEKGRTIRDLAREARVAPSTVLRQVRRMETCRDDPLVDSALRKISEGVREGGTGEDDLARDALPVLRRLAEPGAILAMAQGMDTGVILREEPGRDPRRLGMVARELAEALALRDWIACAAPLGKIHRYVITLAGRTELNRLEGEPRFRGLAEAPVTFLHAGAEEDPRLRHMRSALGESPLQHLARRRDDKGRPFLTREQVTAGERLREDFELVMRGRGRLTDWERWLERLPAPEEVADRAVVSREGAARLRVERALADLGPGLADVALRCCCFLEGLEPLEKRMGWSARSGKVVLRIALDRLRQHYRAEAERCGEMIG